MQLFSLPKKHGGHVLNITLRAEINDAEWFEVARDSEPYAYARRNPNYDLFTDFDFIDEDGMRRSAFYRWVDSYDARYRTILGLAHRDTAEAAIAFLKSARLGPPTAAEIETVRSLAPLLRLAFRTSEALAGSTLHLEGVVDGLEARRIAALVLDGRGAVAFANRTARAVLARGDGLVSVREGVQPVAGPRSRIQVEC